MKISNLVKVGAAILILILGLGGLFAATRINVVRIGGPVQSRMQQASDFVADILPPPEYVIEPFFEATLLLRHPDEYAFRTEHLGRLQKDYDERHAYWRASSLEPSLRDALTVAAHAPARQFWQELNGRFLPAVKARNAAEMETSYRRLEAAYAQHREMIDRAVTLAADDQAKLKALSDDQLNGTIWLLIALAAAALAIIGGACVVLLLRVVRPLVEVVNATTTLAGGGSVAVPHRERADELGEMATAVELFRIAAETRAAADARAGKEQQLVKTSLATSLAALTRGDLTSVVREEFPQGYLVLKTNYNEAVAALREMVQQVSESADQISNGSAEIAHSSEDLARRTESNAASLEQTNAALVRVEDRIKSTSVSARKTVARADTAIATVASGRSIADVAMRAMSRVSGSAKGIDDVIEGLDKIAFQTRVLAMNAAVEAGRAGDAGRGFAVVADLVSALAMRAEEEAKRARDQLTVTQSEIVSAVQSVQDVDGALAAIASDVDEVHVLLGTMAGDNQAQALAISEITAAIGVMDRSTQQNAAMVEQTSAATRALSGEVDALAHRAAAFKFERRVRNIPVAVDYRNQPGVAAGPAARHVKNGSARNGLADAAPSARLH